MLVRSAELLGWLVDFLWLQVDHVWPWRAERHTENPNYQSQPILFHHTTFQSYPLPFFYNCRVITRFPSLEMPPFFLIFGQKNQARLDVLAPF